MYLLCGAIPGGGINFGLHPSRQRQPFCGTDCHCLFTGGNKFRVRLCYRHFLCVVARHIDNGSTDNRQLRRHILQHLGRGDVAGRGIDGKRHQTDIPARQKLRQSLIGLLTEPVNIGALRQAGGINFHHRPDHNDLPFGMAVCQRGYQRQIDTLIQHAVIAQTLRRNGIL